MKKSTKLDENIGGVEKFRAWKYRIMLILEENDLEVFIKEEVAEPEEDEAKAKYKKDMIKAKRIIDDSIKDNLNHQVSSRRTPKEMFDSLSGLFEGININRKMALRNQVIFVGVSYDPLSLDHILLVVGLCFIFFWFCNFLLYESF